ncbi:MAG: hypothetical protein Q8R92_09660 [Deltaproteobacteria bacterium]|nr:hypothetical protein [Deltaproteobacteria bacterium]
MRVLPRGTPRAGGAVRGRRGPARLWAGAAVMAAVELVLADAGHVAAGVPLPHQPDVRFCMANYDFPPTERPALDRSVTDQSRAEVLIYAGNVQKWWFPLPKRSDGKTVRDLNPGVDVLQYLSAGEFPAVATPNEPLPAPSGPTSYLRTRTLTVTEYLRLARAAALPVPDIRDPRPYGFKDGILEFFGGPYTVRANPGGADFIAHARRYARLVRKLGGNGVFLDNLSATAWFLPGVDDAGGDPIRLPPWCLTLEDGRAYWQHAKEGLPVPSLEALKATRKEAVARIRGLDSCRATGAPLEWRTRGQAEAAETALIKALKQEPGTVVMFNGLHLLQAKHALALLGIADGAMMEGFVVGQPPRNVAANLVLVREAARSGKWILLGEGRPDEAAARYSYASYLLVAAPNVCWSWVREAAAVPEMEVLLGPARGSFRALPEGEGRPDQIIFHRAFERGDVYVNPQTRPMPVPGGELPPGTGVVRPRSFADAS